MPHEVISLMESMPQISATEERTDLYFVYPHAQTCGVKFREQKFEIKALVEVIDSINFLPGLNGNIEVWEKLSLHGLEKMIPVSTERYNLVPVWKKRWLGIWKWGNHGPSEVPPGKGQAVASGCQLELSDIKIEEKKFWTLGFESYATEHDEMLKVLRETILMVSKFPQFEVFHKMGYGQHGSAASYPVMLHRFIENKNTAHNGR